MGAFASAMVGAQEMILSSAATSSASTIEDDLGAAYIDGLNDATARFDQETRGKMTLSTTTILIGVSLVVAVSVLIDRAVKPTREEKVIN